MILHVQVALVCIGLCIRGIGPLILESGNKAPMDDEDRERLYIGLASLLFASLAYSVLGVIYQVLVSTGANPPSHSDIMLQSSIIGAYPMLGAPLLLSLVVLQVMICHGICSML